MPELTLVLATYNEAENLPPLVEALEESGEDLHLVVVDDDSPDGTGRIAQQLSEQFGNITVVSRPGRLGLGSALQAGMAAALDTGARYVMTMDADRSHDPEDVPRLLSAMKAGGCDMVQGSRYASGGGVRNWDAKRRLLSRVANLTYRWTAGAPKECTTNFRVFSRSAAKAVLSRAKGSGYEFMAESTLLVMAAGFKIKEVPIIFTGRLSGESKLDKRQVLKGIFLCGAYVLRYRLHLGRFSRRRASDAPALD